MSQTKTENTLAVSSIKMRSVNLSNACSVDSRQTVALFQFSMKLYTFQCCLSEIILYKQISIVFFLFGERK